MADVPVPDLLADLEVTVVEEPEPKPPAKPLAAAVAEAQRDVAQREAARLKDERDRLAAEKSAREQAGAEADAERQQAVRHEVFKRYERLPADVRKALGDLPSPQAQVAAVATYEAARPAAPRSPGAALAPPSPLRPQPKTEYSNADLAQLTLQQRRAVYRDARRGRVRLVSDPVPYGKSR